jgi:hypothetical protein
MKSLDDEIPSEFTQPFLGTVKLLGIFEIFCIWRGEKWFNVFII